ncbi:IucA/IucC family siderophore biosynthesis protein [Francisella sp. Scap27]|uniref:rhizoferrin biosynthesis protein FslA n=1 Tax=Francisella sp. Scap27 TaxID=2589986 RepID=UPI0015BC847F|nr:rhizoferrin biosynthesis protein FslA [Francisella sp. Scap27]QLE79993.1 IucA/IucC family siderophore biosynthesis protein [Francisella sp. Scap27]
MQREQFHNTNAPIDIDSLDLIGLTIREIGLGLEKLKNYTANKQFNRVALSFYREGLLGKVKATEDNLFFYDQESKNTLQTRKASSFSLNRILFTRDIYVVNNDSKNIREINTLQELLNWTKTNNPQINKADWKQFELELNNSFENELYMYIYRSFWQKQLMNNINSSGHSNLWSWICNSLNKNEQFSFLEQWGAVGHIYHPGSKTRLGLSKFENIQYSPEFQAEVDIIFGAIHKNIAHTEIMDSLETTYQEWVINNYPNQHSIWCDELAKKSLDSDDYLMIPIHPWQAAHILPEKHKCLMNCQQLLIIDNCKYTTKPSMSFRTMLPTSNKDGLIEPHIKLPVAIHATSVMRTVSPESVKTGPRVSRILLDILDKEPQIAKSMNILADTVGIHTEKACRKDDIRQLSAIFRENPEKYLSTNEIASPLASLFVKTPNSQSLICDILDSKNYKSSIEILEYFRTYAKITLTTCLDLYLLYGIALEAHQQNTLVVFEDNLPKKLMIRDLGGMRLHIPSIKDAGIVLPKDTFSLTFTDSQSITRRKLIHACLQSNLGELILQLSSHYKINEEDFWLIVRQEIEDRFIALKDRISVKKYNKEFSEIVEKPWSMKALTRMRLNDRLDCDKDDMQGDIYVNLENPLKMLHE